MAKSKRTGVQALAVMKAHRMHKTKGFKGWCLKTCRQAWGLPGGIPSAKKAWEGVPAKYRHYDPDSAPVGAPHFWVSPTFGHVALQSDRKGYIYSTDAPQSDYVGEVPLTWISRHWKRQRYVGWASQFQGVDLDLKVMPK